MPENVNEDVYLDEGKKKQKNENQSNGKKEFNANVYLNTRLGENETERTVKFRIILEKDIDGKNKFAIPVETHSIMLNSKQQKAGTITKGKFKSFICLNDSHLPDKDERGCPMCNKMKNMFAEAYKLVNDGTIKKGSNEWKAMCKAAYKFDSKTTYITKGIERGKEEDGVKFLRYNKRDDGSGIWDAIVSIYKQHMEYGINIFDYENGKDIVLTLTKDPDPKPGAPEKTIIKVSADVIQTPLSKDQSQIEAWVNDTKDWKDMYRSKSYDYLDIVAEGESPIWDKEKGKFTTWMDPEELKKKEEKLELEAAEELKENSKKVETPVENNEEEMDLPF